MKKRLGYGLVFALVGVCFTISACGDDDSSSTEESGGSAGEAGSEAGGSTSGGSANKAGSSTGGSPDGGMPNGGAADGGMGGTSEGGAGGSSAGAAGSDAGAGGAGEPPLAYACGSDTQYKKVCSARVAADCPDPTDCADCVTQVTTEYEEGLVDCAPCDALLGDYYQCGVDAFESGNSAAGMQCIDTIGADFSDTCVQFFDAYFACGTYLFDHECPATWPAE